MRSFSSTPMTGRRDSTQRVMATTSALVMVFQDFQIALAETEAGVALGPLGGLVGEFGDGEVAAVRMPGASGPLAIDP